MGVEEALLTGMPTLPVGSRVARQRLPNGVDILAVEVPSARKVRLVAAVGAGYLDEPRERPGLAHLLEHSLFLGSQDSPQPGTFAAWVGEQGGRYNARTDEFVTDYHLSLPPAAAQEGLIRLIDLLLCPCLVTSAISREIEVIDAEFQARLADPALHRQAALSRLFQPDHPAADFHAGHRGTLGKGSTSICEALGDFHDTHYRAERISVVMLGSASLASQFEMLEAACAVIPGGARPLNRQSNSRWASPAYLQWCLPPKRASRTPRLEMLWPLTSSLAEHHAVLLDRAVTALCDGRLTATLQDTITDMTATVRPEGAGPALCLTLTLTPRGERYIDELLTTCLSAVRELPSHLVNQPCTYPLISETDLDDYALQLARRLAHPPSTVHSDDGFQCAFDELEACLAPSACRVMEEKQGLDTNVEHVPNTLTPFRRASWPEEGASAGATRLAACPAPKIALQNYSIQGVIAGSPTVAECLGDDGPFDLWWAGGSGQQEGAWCLGWPAPRKTQQVRLAAWHQHTLALRQAARNAAVTLTLGGDARGDWLRVQGEPKGLESVASQALAAWPVVTPDSPPGPSQARTLQPHSSQPRAASAGLLAQRMLACLEEPFPRHDAQPLALGKRILSWSVGWLGPSEYLSASQRLATQASELLDFSCGAVEPSHETLSTSVAGVPRWLAPQGEDHALMLQIDGPDDAPVSRLLMRLLADAHDSAFFQELRVRQGLGYVAAVRYREADGWPRLGYVVQSPHADIDDLQAAVMCFLRQQSMALARLGEATLARRRDGLSMQWGPPETSDEAILARWQALRHAVIGTSLFTAMPPKATALILRPWEAMEHALLDVTPGALEEFAASLFAEAPKQWWYHSPAG